MEVREGYQKLGRVASKFSWYHAVTDSGGWKERDHREGADEKAANQREIIGIGRHPQRVLGSLSSTVYMTCLQEDK